MKCNKIHFGAYKQCHMHLKNCSRDAITSPPPNSIASGLASGYAPDVFTCLNSVELALISSRARVNQQHIFSFSGGSHTKVSVHHCLHYNKCNERNRIGNFMRVCYFKKYREQIDLLLQ